MHQYYDMDAVIAAAEERMNLMNYAVILSGGVGTRMRNDGFPKQYLEVQGKPVLLYTLEKFEACESVDRIIIVANEVWAKKIRKWIQQ